MKASANCSDKVVSAPCPKCERIAQAIVEKHAFHLEDDPKVKWPTKAVFYCWECMEQFYADVE